MPEHAKTLKEYLYNNWGEGKFITDGTLTPQRERIHLVPDLSNAMITAASLPVDGPRTQHMISHGSSSISLGNFPLQGGPLLPPGYRGAFIYDTVIKQPGENTHYLPPEFSYLQPVLQKTANTQYAMSPAARDKACFMRLRILPLSEDVAQLGAEFHIHKPDLATQHFRDVAGFFEMGTYDLDVAGCTTPHLLVTENYFSNLAPTMLQTAQSDKPIDLEDRPACLRVRGGTIQNPPFEARQLHEFELAAGNSCTYHSAVDTTPEMNGLSRLFVLFSYYPTKPMEKDYPDLALTN